MRTRIKGQQWFDSPRPPYDGPIRPVQDDLFPEPEPSTGWFMYLAQDTYLAPMDRAPTTVKVIKI